MPVGARVLASHHPTGLKNRRSAHSSTTGPLLRYTRDSLFGHGLDRGRAFHRRLVVNDGRRVNANSGILVLGNTAAREQVSKIQRVIFLSSSLRVPGTTRSM